MTPAEMLARATQPPDMWRDVIDRVRDHLNYGFPATESDTRWLCREVERLRALLTEVVTYTRPSRTEDE